MTEHRHMLIAYDGDDEKFRTPIRVTRKGIVFPYMPELTFGQVLCNAGDYDMTGELDDPFIRPYWDTFLRAQSLAVR